jgi:hypothetical protein
MWDDELVAVNFLGLGKIAAIPAACMVSNLASFYIPMLLLPERHIPRYPFQYYSSTLP